MQRRTFLELVGKTVAAAVASPALAFADPVPDQKGANRDISPFEIDFLRNDLGIELKDEFDRRTKSDYKDNKNLKVLKDDARYGEGYFVSGSNPFAVVLVNDIVRKKGLRTATQADLERALRERTLYLDRSRVDTGLVLRTEDEPNGYLARDLIRQLALRKPTQQYPVLLQLKDLSLRVDNNSPYGLAFLLREEADPIYALVLNQDGGGYVTEDIDEITGLPKQVGGGGSTRLLYSTASVIPSGGLSRMSLIIGSVLHIDNDNLGETRLDDQIVVVKE